MMEWTLPPPCMECFWCASFFSLSSPLFLISSSVHSLRVCFPLFFVFRQLPPTLDPHEGELVSPHTCVATSLHRRHALVGDARLHEDSPLRGACSSAGGH